MGIMGCNKRVIQRSITPRELSKESEHRNKWFKIEYHEFGNVVKITREFQQKVNVRRYLDNPIVQDCRITVLELVDDG